MDGALFTLVPTNITKTGISTFVSEADAVAVAADLVRVAGHTVAAANLVEQIEIDTGFIYSQEIIQLQARGENSATFASSEIRRLSEI